MDDNVRRFLRQEALPTVSPGSNKSARSHDSWGGGIGGHTGETRRLRVKSRFSPATSATFEGSFGIRHLSPTFYIPVLYDWRRRTAVVCANFTRCPPHFFLFFLFRVAAEHRFVSSKKVIDVLGATRKVAVPTIKSAHVS